MLAPEHVRKLNLVEVLLEEAHQLGHCIDPPPEDEVLDWTEEEIRGFFSKAVGACGRKAGGDGGSHPQLPKAQLPDVAIAAPDPEVFKRWVPGLAMSRTHVATPRLRVVCFHSAGSAEDMFSSEGSGTRKAPSPLLEWCRQEEAEMLAVQLPGRGGRMSEPRLTSAQAVADAVLPVLASRLADGTTPYVVVAHSMGCWVAFELLQRVRACKLPLPKAWFLSAMPAPDIPFEERPWRQQHTLDEQGFKEECRGWDINEVVFSKDMWSLYQPLLRADFSIFDTYAFSPATPVPITSNHRNIDGQGSNACSSANALCGFVPFNIPIVAFWGTADRRVKEEKVKEWKRFTFGTFSCHAVQGNHLWPMQKDAKQQWLQLIVAYLKDI